MVVQYEPPEDMTPAEAGTLIDNAADMRDITATMIDLAVKGFIKIEERKREALFGLIKGEEYVLHRLNRGEERGLAAHERRVLDGIFDSRGDAVELSDLKNEFYTELPKIKDGIFARLLTKGYYRSRPDKVAGAWAAGALGVGFLIGFGGSFVAAKFAMTAVPFIVAGVLSTIILMAFAAVMPARTVAGARALEKVKGFEEFLRRVESPQYAQREEDTGAVRPLPAVRDGLRGRGEMGQGVRGDLPGAPPLVCGSQLCSLLGVPVLGPDGELLLVRRDPDVVGAAELEQFGLQRRVVRWGRGWWRRRRLLEWA